MRLLWAVNCFYHFSSFLLCRKKKNKQKKCRTFNLCEKMMLCRRSSDRCGCPGKEPLAVCGEFQVLLEFHAVTSSESPRMAGPEGTWCAGSVCVRHTSSRKVSAFGIGEICRRNLAWLNTLYHLQQVLGFLKKKAQPLVNHPFKVTSA